MGLVFALQPDLRKSRGDTLVLRSSKRRFSLGGMLLFAGALLGTMHFAAAPLFTVLFADGNFLDQLLVGFIYASIYGYPAVAIFCWFFEEVVLLKRDAAGRFDVEGWTQLLGVKWGRRRATGVSYSDLVVENWRGAVNVASIDASKAGKANRYATKGHWLLNVKQGEKRVTIEKRAKVDDVDLVRAQIAAFLDIAPANAGVVDPPVIDSTAPAAPRSI